MADGSYWAPPLHFDESVTIPDAGGRKLVCADCGCDRFKFQEHDSRPSDDDLLAKEEFIYSELWSST